jgi:hypothetical protein
VGITQEKVFFFFLTTYVAFRENLKSPMYTRVRHFGMNARAFVITNPVSSVTSTVPAPEAGNGVAPVTETSDSTFGVDVQEGADGTTDVDGEGGVLVAIGCVVVVMTVEVGAGLVVVLATVVVVATDVVDATVVLGAVVVAGVVVVGAVVVVASTDVHANVTYPGPK